MFYHSFYDPKDRKTIDEIVAFIKATNKPIKYTCGLGYRNPTTKDEPVTKEQILNIILEESTYDIKEYEDFVRVNTFMSGDLW